MVFPCKLSLLITVETRTQKKRSREQYDKNFNTFQFCWTLQSCYIIPLQKHFLRDNQDRAMTRSFVVSKNFAVTYVRFFTMTKLFSKQFLILINNKN